MKILVIGGGNMGFTYAKSILDSGAIVDSEILILETYPPRIEELKTFKGFEIHSSTSCVSNADIILLATKPQHCIELFKEIKPLVTKNQLYISIMAGVTIDTIQENLGTKKVARAMPNLPAQLGKGMTAFTGAKELSQSEIDTVQQLLATTGKSLFVATEPFIDAATGISGSGPAYVFYFMQAMVEAAEKMGFNATEAKLLVSQTFDGAVAQFKQSDDTLTTWMNRVASKGGTTRAALDSFDHNNVNQWIQVGAFAALNRAVELGEK
ncbi:pyrroline-5-carboxylate reductase [Bacteroidota bacterium]